MQDINNHFVIEVSLFHKESERGFSVDFDQIPYFPVKLSINIGRCGVLNLFTRYADDAVTYCKTRQEAENMLENLKQRFEQCGLELHPDKTKIVYCKDADRRGNHDNMKFNFLGYTPKEI